MQTGHQDVRRCPECGRCVKGDKPAKLCHFCVNHLRAQLKAALGAGLGYFIIPG